MTIMSGATVLTLAEGDVAEALITLVLGLLAAFVAYGRRSCLTTLLPESGKSPPSSGRTVRLEGGRRGGAP